MVQLKVLPGGVIETAGAPRELLAPRALPLASLGLTAKKPPL